MSPNQQVRKRFQGRSLRFGVVLAAATLMLWLQTASVFAVGANTAPSVQADGRSVEAVALDRLCVDGLVINHEENPLRGWIVTASYAGDDGVFEPMTTESGRNGQFHFDLPAPGRWLFSVTVPEAWSPVTAPSFEVNVTYGATDCLNILFKLREVVTVYVHKIDDAHQPLAGWTIIATPGPGNPFDTPQTAVTNNLGIATFELPPGPWTFTEQAPDGVEFIVISPADGVQVIDVAAPGPYTIRFKNKIFGGNGCIEVIKRDVPPEGTGEPFGLEDWHIQVLRANEEIAQEGFTNAFGEITFEGLPFGPYVVREIMQRGWEAASPTTYAVVLSRTGDGCQRIEFKNKQVERGFCIEGQKLAWIQGEDFGLEELVGLPEWEITAEPLEDGGFVPEPVFTDGTGHYRIDFPLDDYRIPGSTYTVCEEVRDGWTPAGPTCHTVTLPAREDICVWVDDFVNQQTRNDTPPARGDAPERMERPKQEHPGHHGGMCSAQHRVQRGDTLSRLARHYHTSVQALMRANPQIRNPNRIFVGQVLCIP